MVLKPAILWALGLICCSTLTQAKFSDDTFDVLDYVDQLIGSVDGGNVFCGANLPYGMAKAVADVDGQNMAGFSTDGSNVTGFSHMHDSGTGANPSMGNFPLMPQVCPGEDINNFKFKKAARAVKYHRDSVETRPGYFAVELVDGIHAEMTVTEHAALYHFTFPDTGSHEDGESRIIFLDLNDMRESREFASVTVDDSGRIRANGTFPPSFGSGTYDSFICVDFWGADIQDTGIFVNDRAGNEPKSITVPKGFNEFRVNAGAFVRFASGTRNVNARVGLSFISEDRACRNAEEEIPDPQSGFDKILEAAEDAWRKKLGVISVDARGVNDDFQRTFWSAVYRTMISPQDYTGENPLWKSDEPYYDSFYCLWDSFRSQLPLLAIIDPKALEEMIRSLLDTYKHLGWLPDCRMSLCKGNTQVGSNADVVIADAFVKNISTNIDWNLAYEAVVKDAEVEPFTWWDEGRGGLKSWKSLGYIPAVDFDYTGFGVISRSISRTVEYAYNDFCVASIGKGLGKEYKTYLERSGNWQNLFKDDQRSYINGKDTGFVGFFQPRYQNGTWRFQDPIECSNLGVFCTLTSNPQETYEAGIWENQFFVPHDVSTLIEFLGGKNTFISRLDFLHESGVLNIGNEPAFLATFLYHYAGRPALSAKRAHTYIPSSFNSSNNGLPGNDDSGAMGSFTVFSMMGLFPNPGQNVYFIMPPFFESVSFKHPITNKVATVRNVNFDPTYKNVFIQRATLNGKPYTKNWIGHEFFTQGQTLELVLGSEESDWGTGAGDIPPSVGAGMKFDTHG